MGRAIRVGGAARNAGLGPPGMALSALGRAAFVEGLQLGARAGEQQNVSLWVEGEALPFLQRAKAGGLGRLLSAPEFQQS